ncbi:MAG: polysaccharide export protein [Mucilaginibacter sp.]|jgi:polysaccharide export outer membrane protein|nr:polysaccharide export protein [Mucilaginibacter sp.]
MRPLIPVYLIFGLLFIFTSCSYKQDQVLFEQKNSIPDSVLQKNTANISNYRIKPQDILQITNIQNSKNIIDLNPVNSGNVANSSNSQQGETYQVEEDGTVALTGLGRVQVAGLTRVEARKYIEEQYRKGPLKDPIIDLKIVNLKVTILGEIKSQGNFLLKKDKTTLIELIGEAGGLTEKADEKNIKIIHSDQPNSKPEIIDLSNIRSLSDPRTILQNNDIIYISQNRKAIRNNNIQNFSTVIQPALILFNTALIIFTLTRN